MDLLLEVVNDLGHTVVIADQKSLQLLRGGRLGDISINLYSDAKIMTNVYRTRMKSNR